MRINERCACGASIEVEANSPNTVDRTVKEWRANHNHIVRNPTYPYVTWGQGGAVGGYAPVYTTNSGTRTTEYVSKACMGHHHPGPDGICVWCGKDVDEMGQ